jgi:hypothetical protein
MITPQCRTRTDFPGGNGTDFEWVNSRSLRFAADMRGGPYSTWFHFIVEEPDADVLACELCHGETALGWPYHPSVRPVFRAMDNEWKRVAPTEVNAGAGTMRFAVPCGRRTTEIAFCYPYQLANWQRFYQRILAPAGARAVEVGVSELGQALFAYECDGDPVEILLSARRHSGATPGSYALEGAFAALIAGGGSGLTVRAIPFVDVDRVLAGMYGKERPPVEFERAWSAEPPRVEIEACKRYLASLPRPRAVAADFHAPGPNDPHYLDGGMSGGAPSDFAHRLKRLVECVTRRCARRPRTAFSAELSGAHGVVRAGIRALSRRASASELRRTGLHRRGGVSRGVQWERGGAAAVA